MGRHLGIDFSSILVDSGSEVGRQNRAKIDAKRYRKNDGKKKGTMIAKKLEKVPATPSDWGGPGSRGGHILICGVNPALARRDGGEMVHCLGCLS